MICGGHHEDEKPRKKAGCQFLCEWFLFSIKGSPCDNPRKDRKEQTINRPINQPPPDYQPGQVGSCELFRCRPRQDVLYQQSPKNQSKQNSPNCFPGKPCFQIQVSLLYINREKSNDGHK